ncbi:BPSS1187 family protein [Nocardia sp. NPDC088792]|uniref:BPSS1187 family protein n=1 Tax=Nocardia sp. NPDC088792 TaxID=3364332 RepID=UPI0037FA81C3
MKRSLVWLLVLGLVVAGITACTHGRAAANPVDLRQIAPSSTDPAISSPDNPHLVAPVQPGPASGLLFVNLGGSGSTPNDYTELVGQAASLGFHSIGLSYPDKPTVAQRCGKDLDCYGPLRQNVFDGAPDPHSSVDAANSIQHRLVALLQTLQQQYPAEGWGDFLGQDGLPVYDKIVFAGHSQGGGEAAYIGKLHRLAGVVMFSSVVDSNAAENPVADPTPASWVNADHLTPIANYTGVVNVGDPFVKSIRADWTALGLDSLGAPAQVGAVAAPFGGTHELVTKEGLNLDPLRNHLSPVVDQATPKCPNGTPELAPAWTYLMLTAAGLPVPDLSNAC